MRAITHGKTQHTHILWYSLAVCCWWWWPVLWPGGSPLLLLHAIVAAAHELILLYDSSIIDCSVYRSWTAASPGA
jgi:hypothetical protein